MNWKLKERIIREFGSQADFAYEMQVSDSYVSRVVRGRDNLSQEAKEEWAEVLGCYVSDIFGEEE